MHKAKEQMPQLPVHCMRASYVIAKERHETIMGYKPRERVAPKWFIPIIVELLVL